MAEIKNLHLITDLSEKDLTLMEQAALAHRRFSNITFKILEYSDKKVVIRVTQGRSAAGNYHPQKRLVEVVHETFDRFFKDKKILVRPFEYKEPAPNLVNQEWIQKRMTDTGTKLKDIADETGIDYTQLSSLVTGNRPLSQPMKALFYYYFLAIKHAQEQGA